MAKTNQEPDVESGGGGGKLDAAGSRAGAGILLVARNGLALTKRAIRSALAQDVPAKVLVIDNQSTDGTNSWLLAKDGISRIMCMEQHSLSWCWNTGLRSLWSAGCSSVLVINNDVEIRSDTLSMLLAHGGEFVTCVSVDSVDRIGTPGDRSIEDLRAGERCHPDFSSFLIRKSVWDKGLRFDEECFPAYAEDSFAHTWMHQHGIRAVCIDLPFYHYAAGTLKGSSPGESERIKRGAGANRERFRQKYGCLPGSAEYEALF